MVGLVSQSNIFEITSLVSREDGTGKLALPVDAAVLLYSRYKHVRGTPSFGSIQGVSLSRLRALDNLIERLIRLRGHQPIVRNIEDLTQQEIEGLIETYRKGVHRALTTETQMQQPASAWEDLGLTLNTVA